MSREEIADLLVYLFYRVDWGAWEAIGTVGALWFGVYLAGRGARTERLAALGFMNHLEMTTTAILMATPILAEDDRGARLRSRLREGRDLVANLSAGLRTFPLEQFVRVNLGQQYAALPAALHDMAHAADGMMKEATPLQQGIPDKRLLAQFNFGRAKLKRIRDEVYLERLRLQHGRRFIQVRRVERLMKRGPLPDNFRFDPWAHFGDLWRAVTGRRADQSAQE